ASTNMGTITSGHPWRISESVPSKSNRTCPTSGRGAIGAGSSTLAHWLGFATPCGRGLNSFLRLRPDGLHLQERPRARGLIDLPARILGHCRSSGRFQTDEKTFCVFDVELLEHVPRQEHPVDHPEALRVVAASRVKVFVVRFQKAVVDSIGLSLGRRIGPEH